MAVSEEDLEKKRQKVETLRAKVVDAQFLREERERELSRDIEAKQLDAEADRLEGELSIAKELAKVSTVKAGASDLADAVREPATLASPTSAPEPAAAGKE